MSEIITSDEDGRLNDIHRKLRGNGYDSIASRDIQFLFMIINRMRPKPSRSFADLQAILTNHGIDMLPGGKEELARRWRAREVSDDDFIQGIQGV